MKLSIGVKLTLGSTLLVALVVAFLGYVNARKIQALHEEQAAQLSKSLKETAASQARSTATALAPLVRQAVEGTELGTLSAAVNDLARDPNVKFALVTDEELNILADSTRKVEAASLPKLALPRAQALKPSYQEIDDDGTPLLKVIQPMLASSGKGETFRGVVVFAYELTSLNEQLKQIESDRAVKRKESLKSTLLVGGVALIVGLLLSLLQAYRFARPIRRLAATAARIANGDLAARVIVESQDEVGSLGTQFNHMADRIQQLLVETVSKAELEHELNLARQIQSVLVPGEGTHTAAGFEVSGYYEPATTCGGDFWDFAALPRGCSTILVGDVTGHGVPAAMLTATAKACLDTLRHLQGENLQVAETLRVLDRVIRDAGAGSFFMTASCAFLDTYQSTLFFSSAGHPPALLLRWTDGGIKLTRLVSRGNRLGDGDPSGFESRRTKVLKGDVIVWYTDGLIESVDPSGKQYGTRRLLRSLSQLPPDVTPEDAVARVIGSFNEFRAEVPLDDDVTMVVGRIM